MAKRAKPIQRAYNQFICTLCKDIEALEPSDFKKHREEAHDDSDHRGRKRMTMHLDAADWYESHYEWKKESDDSVFALQVIRLPRRGLNKAIWSDPP